MLSNATILDQEKNAPNLYFDTKKVIQENISYEKKYQNKGPLKMYQNLGPKLENVTLNRVSK